MTLIKSSEARELESILEDLPAEKAQELLNFARYLRQHYTPHPSRGSAAAILQSLRDPGPLEFEEDELDQLLAELEAMRQLDLTTDG